MKPENINWSGSYRNRKKGGSKGESRESPASLHPAKNTQIPRELELRLSREISNRLEDFANDLKKDLRNAVKTEVAAAIRASLHDEIRRETEDEVKLEIRSELQEEMEDRLASIAEERTRFDPARIVEIFSETSAKLLRWEIQERADLPTQQQLAAALKQGVLEALRSRKLHLSQLAEIDRMVKSGRLNDLALLLEEWFLRAGLVRSRDAFTYPEYFAAVNDPREGTFLHVLESAYIDESTGQVVRAGRLRYSMEPQSSEVSD